MALHGMFAAGNRVRGIGDRCYLLSAGRRHGRLHDVKVAARLSQTAAADRRVFGSRGVMRTCLRSKASGVKATSTPDVAQ